MGRMARYITSDGAAVCAVLDATDLVSEIERIHVTSAVVTAALGRLSAGAALMAGMLKDEAHSLTLRVAGGGPAGTLIAVANGRGEVKADVVNPVVELPLNKNGKLDVGGAVGRDGFLSVARDVGHAEPQTGYSPLVSGEIGDDITYYFAKSEQIPTVCALGVLVNPDLSVGSAGGYLIQLLPGADEGTIEQVERNIAALPPVSSMFRDGETPDRIAKRAMAGFELELLDEKNVVYRCDCSRERAERALVSLSPEEVRETLAEQGQIEVNCHFCGAKYRFSGPEMDKLILSKFREERT